MEILDNMPHDRIYIDPKTGLFSSQVEIQITTDLSKAQEIDLKEVQTPITDSLVSEFIKHYQSLPEADHIKPTQRLKMSGVIKRIQDIWDDFRFRDKINSNIFAPTAALYLF